MINDKVYKIIKCRLCGNGVHVVSKLAKTPVGDRFFKLKENAISQQIHNVELSLCSDCGQLQLSEVIEPAQVYDEEYLYTTAVSHGLPEHFKKSAQEIGEKFNLHNGSFVVEIGSNEGIMLEAFKLNGAKVLGIDPAKIAADKALSRNIDTINDFFTKELADKIKVNYGMADIIIANNVIANIPDLRSVVQAIELLLKDDGVFIFETSYVIDVIQKQLIDTIYHEHISYLSVKPLIKFFDSCELNFFDAEHINTKGGSLRGYVCKKTAKKEQSKAILEISQNESKYSLLDSNMYALFDKNLDDIKSKLQDICIALKNSNEKIVVYGASVGCVMMIYQFGLDKYIDCIIDDNLAKIDRYCPHDGFVVYDSSMLEEGGIKTVISLAWRFMEPICKRHAKFLNSGGKFLVVDLPNATIKETIK